MACAVKISALQAHYFLNLAFSSLKINLFLPPNHMRMKKIAFTLVLATLISMNAMAQFTSRDWVLGVSWSFIDFKSIDEGAFFQTSNWNNDIGPTRLHLTRSLGSSFNVGAQLSIADIDKYVTPIGKKFFTDFGLDLQYKFANGYILDANSWFDPYISTGGGLMNLNKETYPMIGAGLGSNFWISDRFGINLQTGIHLPIDFDTYQKHSFGFVFNLGEVSDRDGDGVADNVDRCPDEPGSKLNEGCPSVKREDKVLIENIAKRIYFETDSDVLKPESKLDLDLLSDVLKRNPQANLMIEGHTDSSGDDAHNLDLSKRRASSVVKYLVEKGIAASRLSSEGYGETMPVASNDTPEGRAQNRRVELKVKN
jgi:outer membrane protein OmpA-like peptidoglycan-associated protein